MKTTLMMACLGLISQGLLAQMRITSPTQIFYVGADNVVEIQGAKVRTKNSGVKLEAQANGRYLVQVNQAAQDVELLLEENGHTHTLVYKSKSLPMPTLSLNGKGSGAVSAEVFQAQKGLALSFPGLDLQTRCEVASFDLVHAPKKGKEKMQSQTTKGSFSPEILALMKEASAGDAMMFLNVKYQCGEEQAKEIPGLSFVVK